MSSAESLPRHRVKNMVQSAIENTRPQVSEQGESETCLHGFYYRRVFRGSQVAECAVLKAMNVTSRKALGHKALNKSLRS